MYSRKNVNSYCLDCNQETSAEHCIRCRECTDKFKIGINNPNWKGGIPKCLDCKMKLGDRNSIYCNTHAKVGERNPTWKGGITLLHMKIRNSKIHIDLLKESKKRDNYQCLMPNCDSNSKILHSNHIKTFSKIIEENNIKTFKDAENCKELWNPKNLITLCKSCHNYIRGKEKEFENLFNLILKKLYYEKI